MKDLSILIPAKDESYLQQTVDDIFKHAETDIEVIVGLDGYSPEKSIVMPDNAQHVIHWNNKSIGQRAMMNKLFSYSTGKYIAKTDAHCSFQQGFDRILLEEMDDKTVMTPMLAQLEPEDWRIIPQPITTNYYFNKDLEFQYEPERSTEPLVETMALQGSFYLLPRKMYFDLNMNDESLGSWGFSGVETALKAWNSGARVITNTNCFYGHWFRNKLTGEQRYTEEEAKKVQKKMKKMFPLEDIMWLVKKFNYPCDWGVGKNK